MRFRKAASAVLVVVFSFAATALMTTGGAETAEAKPPPGKGKNAPSTSTTTETGSTTTGTGSTTSTSVNPVDADFVSMMIPHHQQALVMSQMAPSRSNDQNLLALASQIEVEQGLEISMMQAWQSWNGLEVTDAEQAYQDVLQDPMMLEDMGMATPEQLDALSAAQGTEFDVLYLQLMIQHHEGALDMIVEVLSHGSDQTLMWWANDMFVTQQSQIFWMDSMLANKT